jgi:hypothetical protein
VPGHRLGTHALTKGAAIAPLEEERDGVTIFGRLAIADAELESLSRAMIVERLVDSGVSRLSAERIVAVQRDNVEPGRARRHAKAYR